MFKVQLLYPTIYLCARVSTVSFKKRKNDFNFGPTFQLGPKFMKETGLKHVTFSTADGALEAAPAVRDSVCFIRSCSFKICNYQAYN